MGKLLTLIHQYCFRGAANVVSLSMHDIFTMTTNKAHAMCCYISCLNDINYTGVLWQGKYI